MLKTGCYVNPVDELPTPVLLLLFTNMLGKCCSDCDRTPNDNTLVLDFKLTPLQRVFTLRTQESFTYYGVRALWPLWRSCSVTRAELILSLSPLVQWVRSFMIVIESGLVDFWNDIKWPSHSIAWTTFMALLRVSLSSFGSGRLFVKVYRPLSWTASSSSGLVIRSRMLLFLQMRDNVGMLILWFNQLSWRSTSSLRLHFKNYIKRSWITL